MKSTIVSPMHVGYYADFGNFDQQESFKQRKYINLVIINIW